MNGVHINLVVPSGVTTMPRPCVSLGRAVPCFAIRSSNQEAILFNAHPAIIVGENFFCIYFTVEIIIRFMAFQRKINAFKDFWLLS